MCEAHNFDMHSKPGYRTIPVHEAVGLVLAHDITEIRKDEFKGRAFKKGHIVRKEDISHLRRLGKEHLFVLSLSDEDMHEDEAAYALAQALAGDGVELGEGPKEGKINIVARRDGLLKIDREGLHRFNMLGEVMCATLHTNVTVRKGQTVAGTRAIPLVVKRSLVQDAVAIGKAAGGIIEVREMRKPRAGIVITGSEVYNRRIKDAFGPVIISKLEAFQAEVIGLRYAPDDEKIITRCLRELIEAGADLLITTGGMSVDPDDVTRFAIRSLGVSHMTYGSAVLPGAMFLVGYVEAKRNGNGKSGGNGRGRPDGPGSAKVGPVSLLGRENDIPVLGIPACGMYARTTIFDLILPRVLAGERIGRRQLAELGHGGLCLHCKECRYPVCPFGK